MIVLTKELDFYHEGWRREVFPVGAELDEASEAGKHALEFKFGEKKTDKKTDKKSVGSAPENKSLAGGEENKTL